jgi:hypothetical protein
MTKPTIYHSGYNDVKHCLAIPAGCNTKGVLNPIRQNFEVHFLLVDVKIRNTSGTNPFSEPVCTMIIHR